MVPEETLMRCSKGWRVHCPLLFFLLRLFQAHLRSTVCSSLNPLHEPKVEKGEGSGVGGHSHLPLSMG
jgi:hypothetical protein